MLQTYIWDLFSSNTSWHASNPDRICSSFPQFLQASGIVPHLGHDCFLSYPFQFIFHLSQYHQMLHSLDTECIIKLKKNICLDYYQIVSCMDSMHCQQQMLQNVICYVQILDQKSFSLYMLFNITNVTAVSVLYNQFLGTQPLLRI